MLHRLDCKMVWNDGRLDTFLITAISETITPSKTIPKVATIPDNDNADGDEPFDIFSMEVAAEPPTKKNESSEEGGKG